MNNNFQREEKVSVKPKAKKLKGGPKTWKLFGVVVAIETIGNSLVNIDIQKKLSLKPKTALWNSVKPTHPNSFQDIFKNSNLPRNAKFITYH